MGQKNTVLMVFLRNKRVFHGYVSLLEGDAEGTSRLVDLDVVHG